MPLDPDIERERVEEEFVAESLHERGYCDPRTCPLCKVEREVSHE